MQCVVFMVLLAVLGADETPGVAEASKTEASKTEASKTVPAPSQKLVESLIQLFGGRSAEPKPSAEFDAELKSGVKLTVGEDEPIDVAIGHAAPFVGDFDGDGRSDLLVGQFGGGKLRIYRNVAPEGPPRFQGFKFFQADGKDATVPFG